MSLHKFAPEVYCCPKTGLMMPWYTEPMLEYLNTLDLKGKRVFEYGVGYSTLWWRAITGPTDEGVYGVDDNLGWSYTLDPPNNEGTGYIGFCSNKKEYVNFLVGNPDIVIIDGSYRKECLQYAIDHCKKGTMIICDNWLQPSAYSDWGNMPEVVAKYNPVVFKQPDHEDWQTMYFYL